MRNTIENRTVETSGLQEAQTFTFAAGAKAFKIFIDGIYSDKVRAIIREYWTNAYDAHILVGKQDVPFNCQLPTAFNPELIIRDFGPGVSHERMMRDFTQAFLSSKDNSDDFVGALGLGRLSAFSYTDSFNVNTYIAKEKRSYVVFLNSGNIPELSLMSATPTDEEDGFEVRFPVKSGDCQNFWRAAEFTSIGFSVKPNITNEGFNFPDVKAEGKSWSICSYLPGVHAKQGCVIYPVDISIVQELGDFEAILETKGLVIDFPIGSLDFSASREALGYNELTRANLKKTFSEMHHTMTEDARAELSKAKTWASAALIIRNLAHRGIHKSIIKSLIWNGQTVPTYREVKNSTFKSHNVTLYGHSPKFSAKRFTLEMSEKLVFTPSENTIVYSAKHGTPSITPRVLMHMNSISGANYVYIIHHADARGLERMRRILGYPEIIAVETLPKPPVAAREKRDAKEQGYARCFLPDIDNGRFSENEVCVNNGGPYLTIERGDLNGFDAAVICGLIKELNKNGNHILDDLIAINPSQVERFEKRGWVNATSLIRETVYATFSTEEYRNSLFLCNADSDNYLFSDHHALEDVDFDTLLGSKHPFTQCVKSGLELIAKMLPSYNMITRIARISSTPIEPLEPQSSIDQKATYASLLLEFPMLVLIDNPEQLFKRNNYRFNEEKSKILLDYLKKEEYQDTQMSLAA